MAKSAGRTLVCCAVFSVLALLLYASRTSWYVRATGRLLETISCDVHANITRYTPPYTSAGLTPESGPDPDIKHVDICTNDLFRQYYADRDYFPGGGKWVVTSDHEQYTYLPEMCRFSRRTQLGKGFLREGITRAGIKRIVQLGDSNAVRYFTAFINHFQSEFGRCDLTRQETLLAGGFAPDLTYFTNDSVTLTALSDMANRPCRTCSSRTVRCHGKGRSVTVEHVSLYNIVGTKNGSIMSDQRRAVTDLNEFILTKYLARRKPDVLIIYPPFNHDKAQPFPPDELTTRLRFKHKLIRDSVPTPAQIVWIPSMREFVNRKPPEHQNRTFNNMTSLASLDILNHALYRAIREDLLNASSLVFGFLDLVNVSSSREDLSADGVHMKAIWYDVMTSLILQLLFS